MKTPRELETSLRPPGSAAPMNSGCGRRFCRAAALAVYCLAAISEINCGIAGTPPKHPGPPSNVGVTVSPSSANLFLGSTQQFQAIVTGSSNESVTWEVNGVIGGTASAGTISAGGLYTAPAILPAPPSATVTAVSRADPHASCSAIVSREDDVAVTVAPSTVNVPTNGEQVFAASETAMGNPAAGFTW